MNASRSSAAGTRHRLDRAASATLGPNAVQVEAEGASDRERRFAIRCFRKGLRRAALASSLLAACGPGTPPVGLYANVDRLDAAVDTDGGSDGAAAEAGEPRLTPDGTWLLWAETSTCVGIGNLGIHGLTEAVGTVELSVDADGVVRHAFRKCHVEQTPVLGMATTIPDAISRSLPVRSYVGLLDDAAVGSAYQSRLDIELWAVRLDDPNHDALPTTADDPRVFDQDADGKPGVTLVLGDATCEMYVVQRGKMKWSGAVVSATRIEGGGSSTSEQVVLSSTGGFCATGHRTWFPPDDARFVLMRVDGKHGSIDLDKDGDGRVSCDEAVAYGVGPFAPRTPDNSVCQVDPGDG